MTRVARGLARALVFAGFALVALGIVVTLVGVYVGSWPLRRLARRSAAGARVAAVQTALLAVGELVAAFRTSSREP